MSKISRKFRVVLTYEFDSFLSHQSSVQKIFYLPQHKTQTACIVQTYIDEKLT